VLFEHAADAIFFADPTGRFLDVNQAACELLGYTHAELLDRAVTDIVADDSGAYTPDALTGTFENGDTVRRRRRVLRKDATTVPVESHTRRLGDGHFVTVVRDLSEQLRMQAQLVVADRMVSLGTLAAGVAHEINNPLAAALLMLEQIEIDSQPEDPNDHTPRLDGISEAVGDARKALWRVNTIVRDLKLFARADEQPPCPVDLRSVCDTAIQLCAAELRQRATVVRHYAAAPPVMAPEARLVQVVVNLIVNAAHAIVDGNAPRQKVTIVTSTDEAGNGVLEVRDTGNGIEPAAMEHLFEPFFTTKPHGVGTGLGLSICHGIVTSLGGTISAESTVGKGAIFRVILPPSPTSLRAPEAASMPRSDRMQGARGRVLVVDDDPLQTLAVTRALEGVDVIAVSSGRQALAACSRQLFDCIVCDVMMPDMSGADLFEALCARDPGMQRTFVFVCAGAFTERSRSFLEGVRNRVLPKPFSRDELRTAVAEVLGVAPARTRPPDGVSP